MRLCSIIFRAGSILLSMLLSAGMAAAGTCPECPSGCVPEASVAQFIPALPADVIHACPWGCVPVRMVKKYKVPPPCLSASKKDDNAAEETKPDSKLFPALPPGAQPLLPNPDDIPVDSPVSVNDASRHSIIFGPTAFEGIAGQMSVEAHEFQIVDFRYNPTRNLQLGAVMTLPVIGLGGFGAIKYNIAVADQMAVGFGAFGGAISSVGSFATESLWWFAGGHFSMSYSTKGGSVFNIGSILTAAGRTITMYDSFKQDDGFTGFVPVPYIGISTVISPSWAFTAEIALPVTEFIHEDNPDSFDIGNPFLLYYGFRFSKKRIYGDLGFFIPLTSLLIRFLMYCPPGLPYLSFGVRM